MSNYKPHKAQSYCFANNIYIYPIPYNKKSFYLEVDYKGTKKKSDQFCKERLYSVKKGWDKVWELYEYFYDKRVIKKC